MVNAVGASSRVAWQNKLCYLSRKHIQERFPYEATCDTLGRMYSHSNFGPWQLCSEARKPLSERRGLRWFANIEAPSIYRERRFSGQVEWVFVCQARDHKEAAHLGMTETLALISGMPRCVLNSHIPYSIRQLHRDDIRSSIRCSIPRVEVAPHRMETIIISSLPYDDNWISYSAFIKSLTAFAANLFLSASGKSAPISIHVNMESSECIRVSHLWPPAFSTLKLQADLLHPHSQLLYRRPCLR